MGFAIAEEFGAACKRNGADRTCDAMEKSVPGIKKATPPATALTPINPPEKIRRMLELVGRQVVSFDDEFFSYHIFNELLPAATLSGGFGKIMISNNTVANLNGCGQVVISHAQPSGSSPCPGGKIKLFSGLGEVVEIIKQDIPFDYGLIHILDR